MCSKNIVLESESNKLWQNEQDKILFTQDLLNAEQDFLTFFFRIFANIIPKGPELRAKISMRMF
jgi:hypothetical protein